MNNYYQLIGGIIIGLIGIFLGYQAFIKNNEIIQNLIQSKENTLKEVFFGDSPYLFYCARSNVGIHAKEDKIPKSFTDAAKTHYNKVNFAIANCSHVLPSGKNIYERFKLKKDLRPTIFGTAPWLKVKQANRDHLKDAETMKKFIDITIAPKATPIINDKDLHKFCGFDKSESIAKDQRSVTETCIVLLKGTRYGKSHSELEAKLVRHNPKTKIAIVDASKKRLSFENPEEISADMFGLKVHAIRNGTHYYSMVNPVTWDYLSTFVSHAVGTPLYEYSGDGNTPISLLKLSSPVFTRKSSKKKVSSDSSKKSKATTDDEEDEDDSEDEEKIEEQSKSYTSSSNTDDADIKERERIRRERMDRQSRERLFEDDDEPVTSYSTEEEDEEIIEL